jgi:hypothetical protein
MKPASLPWKLFSGVLMSAGIGWMVYILCSTLEEPSRFIPDSPGWLMVATLFVALSIGMMTVIFGLFLNSDDARCYPAGLVARLHLAGQLLRYLPGRLWGIVFQISASRENIPAAHLARANLDFMAFSVVGSLVIGFILLVYQGLWPWWAAAAAAAGGGVILSGLFLGGANKMLLRVGRFLPEKARRIFGLLPTRQPTLYRLAVIMGAFMVSWAAYLAGWSLLRLVYKEFAQVDFVSLCAYYTLASGIGILSVITPAGLGVREAAFIMLAVGSADRETAAFFAAFGRLWLMVVEFVLLAAATLFFSDRKESLR